MTANELRRLYIDFFVKKYDHKEVKGASLIPENDPTVLFTTAGMHPLVPFLMGESHPSGKRVADVQKCVRTDDIDEVGDDCHLTFFEMLGNWSFGDYFKEEAIKMSFEFLTSEKFGLGLSVKDLAVSCFKGDENAPKDDESAKIWVSLGVSADRIAFLPKKDNWWGPAGQTGPCGPDTEMFFWTGEGEAPERFDNSDKRWVELWNDVFMQYNKKEDGTYEPLKQKNVDTGMGLERVMAVMNGVKSPFDTELFADVVEEIDLLSAYDLKSFIAKYQGFQLINDRFCKADGAPYDNLEEVSDMEKIRSLRIIADHLRSATFIIGDQFGVSPSNTDQGYVVRRLIRRAIRHGQKLGIEEDFARKIAGIIVKNYGDFYTELKENRERIFEEMSKEERKFRSTLHRGLNVLHKKLEKTEKIPDDFCFEMFATYGFPVEMAIEELTALGLIKDKSEKDNLIEKFDKCFSEHQKLSQSGAEKKFSGGLADHSEAVTKLHTATHLLHQSLRQVLGNHVEQRGANITAERLRFDFSHNEKMTEEQKIEVEKIVNEQIKKALPVLCEEMSVPEAKAKGAIGLFESKYGETVKVYTIGNPNDNNVFSMEICGGPHVNNTSELGVFRLKKEESSSSGVRRIKAVLE